MSRETVSLVVRQLGEIHDGDILANAFVPGKPKTKGSMTGFSDHQVRQSVTGSTDWQNIMTKWLRDTVSRLRGRTKADPLWVREVTLVAVFLLPTTATGLIAQRAGDLDKLLRNACDAMENAGVYGNDSQVVRVVTEKLSASAEGRICGVVLTAFAGRVRG